MVKTMGEFLALEVIVTVLWNLPIRCVLYFTIILSDSFFFRGVLDYEGMVQPHEERTLVNINGDFPVFL